MPHFCPFIPRNLTPCLMILSALEDSRIICTVGSVAAYHRGQFKTSRTLFWLASQWPESPVIWNVMRRVYINGRCCPVFLRGKEAERFISTVRKERTKYNGILFKNREDVIMRLLYSLKLFTNILVLFWPMVELLSSDIITFRHNCVTYLGQWNVSDSDSCQFCKKILQAIVICHILFPSATITVNKGDGDLFFNLTLMVNFMCPVG